MPKQDWEIDDERMTLQSEMAAEFEHDRKVALEEERSRITVLEVLQGLGFFKPERLAVDGNLANAPMWACPANSNCGRSMVKAGKAAKALREAADPLVKLDIERVLLHTCEIFYFG